MNEFYLIIAIGLVAFLYSSVGHGGASGYLAMMTIFGFALAEMRSSAFILNIIVAGIAFLSYFSASHSNLKKLLPFLTGSIPAVFLGAMIESSTFVYRIILAAVLIIAILRMLLSIRNSYYETREIPFITALIAGFGIGFISGIIGIGGGILLSPLLILNRWASIRETACLSAAFIVINSITGLTGVLVTGIYLSPLLVVCIMVAFTGGLLGSMMGSRLFPLNLIRYTLMIVLLFASIKLFIG